MKLMASFMMETFTTVIVIPFCLRANIVLMWNQKSYYVQIWISLFCLNAYWNISQLLHRYLLIRTLIYCLFLLIRKHFDQIISVSKCKHNDLCLLSIVKKEKGKQYNQVATKLIVSVDWTLNYWIWFHFWKQNSIIIKSYFFFLPSAVIQILKVSSFIKTAGHLFWLSFAESSWCDWSFWAKKYCNLSGAVLHKVSTVFFILYSTLVYNVKTLPFNISARKTVPKVQDINPALFGFLNLYTLSTHNLKGFD